MLLSIMVYSINSKREKYYEVINIISSFVYVNLRKADKLKLICLSLLAKITRWAFRWATRIL
jgi:hypothetical protein